MPAPADELIETLATLRALRAEAGRADEPFLFHAYSLPDQSVDDHRRLVEAGLTTFYVGMLGPLAEVRSDLERFLEDVAEPLRASGHVAAAASDLDPV
jgi:hypothetical protein